jgi:hypothetical protein
MEIINKKGGGQFLSIVEKGKRLPWFHQIPLECLDLMHALFEHIPLHVLMPMCDVIVPMEVKKGL